MDLGNAYVLWALFNMQMNALTARLDVQVRPQVFARLVRLVGFRTIRDNKLAPLALLADTQALLETWCAAIAVQVKARQLAKQHAPIALPTTIGIMDSRTGSDVGDVMPMLLRLTGSRRVVLPA